MQVCKYTILVIIIVHIVSVSYVATPDRIEKITGYKRCKNSGRLLNLFLYLIRETKMKKIFAVVQVQNEADIIESLCRYYCSFCDGILVTDNMSSDNTRDILNSLANEGLPVYTMDRNDIVLDREKPNPRLQQYHLAIDRYNADIVLPIDADEFLVNVNGGSPRPVLESLDESVEYHIFRHNYICPRNIKTASFFPENTDKYVELLSPKTIISRFLIKEKNAFPAPGCHSFCYNEDPPEIVNMKILCYNHYPIRNAYQFMFRSILKWSLYLTRPYHDGSMHFERGWHHKAFYEEIKKHGTISHEMLERYSAYTSTSIPDDNNFELFEKQFDMSFCRDKINLRYTDYDSHKKYFIQMLTTQLEKDLRNMPSWRSAMERKVAGEQLGQANATISHLNAYIETLHKQVPPQNRNGTFYFDTGKNFNEEETVHFQHDKKTNYLDIKIDLPQNVQSVRFDPVEGCGCFLQDLVIMSDAGETVDFQILNGFKSENKGIAFTTTDPQILIDVKNKKIKKMTVQCNIWLFN